MITETVRNAIDNGSISNKISYLNHNREGGFNLRMGCMDIYISEENEVIVKLFFKDKDTQLTVQKLQHKSSQST